MSDQYFHFQSYDKIINNIIYLTYFYVNFMFFWLINIRKNNYNAFQLNIRKHEYN